MALDCSPKKFAEDVAGGFQMLNRTTLKKYSPDEVYKIMSGLDVVAREIRSTPVETGDYDGLKAKSMKMQKINGALMVIRTWIKEQKMMEKL